MLLVAAAFAVSVPALSYVTATASTTASSVAGYAGVTSGVTCARSLDAAALGRVFAGRIGPIIGADNQHAIRLGRRRTLWLFSDAFIDDTGSARTLTQARMIANAAVIQRGRCFRIVRANPGARIVPFEPRRPGMSDERVFWPLGGEAHGDRIFVFWAEMKRNPLPPPGDGIYRHPVRTWLATYDRATLARIRMRPAPNDGVVPQYGYAVASDERHTYLFGNPNLLNLAMQGGFYSGPHSATRMFLARVPRGRLGAQPHYRTRRGWSSDPAAARPFSSRFWTENGMQPRFVAGHWVSVTKVDGLWGTRTIFEAAARPWGPWRVVSRRRIWPLLGYNEMNNYQPIIVPYRNRPGNFIIVMSQNARDWSEALADPSRYRPQVYMEPWPFGR
jgi:hypothetical protein